MIHEFSNACGVKPSRLHKATLLFILQYMFRGAPYGVLYFVIAELFQPKDMIHGKRLFLLISTMVGMVFLSMLFEIAARTTLAKNATGLTCAARLNLAEHLRKLSLGFFKKQDPGDITGLLLNDMAKVEEIFSHIFSEIVSSIVLPVIIGATFLAIDWRIGLAAIASALLAQGIFAASRTLILRVCGTHHIAARKAVSRTLEYLQGIKGLKAFNMTGAKFSRMDKAFLNFRDASIKQEVGMSVAVGCYFVFLKISFMGFILLDLSRLLQGDLSIPASLFFVVIGYRFYQPLENFGFYMSELRYMKLALERIVAVNSVEPLPGKEKVALEKFDIEFKDVTFSYHNSETLKDVSFFIPEHSLTALIGPSGSGKTTITSLIARFWDVDQGEIRIGGKRIKDVEPDRLLTSISMVFQNVYLFHDTVYNNIKVGKKDATREEIIAAAKAAHCHEFIEELEHGYDTIVGEGGSTLSGGEKQRISIARAILKDAPIVLLDEATASLDPENELLIQQAINKLVQSKTLIVVAHRLKTIQNADQILVLDKGRVIEQGRHNKLVQAGGLYQHLWEEQTQAYGWNFETASN